MNPNSERPGLAIAPMKNGKSQAANFKSLSAV